MELKGSIVIAVVAGSVLAAIVVVTQIVKLWMLIHRRIKIKDYNKFVDITFTQNERDTPAIILRVQNGNILHYNKFQERCRFLSIFFRQIPYIGDSPVKVVDLFPNRSSWML